MSLISESGMFAHAPISKALIMATLIGSGMKVSGARTVPFVNRILFPFGFPRLLEVLCAVCLLFVFRQLERQMSSRKFVAYVAVSQAATEALQYSLARTTGYRYQSGPYGIIFSLLVLFHFEVPVLSKFPVFEYDVVSDKSFIYMAALQLSVYSGFRSASVSCIATFVGLLLTSRSVGGFASSG
uniref:Peptidase S54 rhomboid domain-containing protein n=1 Tax=Rhodosorus marinus TaxID=101924 RepID=A0A7S0BSU7_9RHOD|mmetsp:Transcript_6978/g.10307  ORF Transcript_6978/g.10307 Transcript_6978/m.10307 type:complete len:184 (+) Transcript_6978:302-853(+)